MDGYHLEEVGGVAIDNIADCFVTRFGDASWKACDKAVHVRTGTESGNATNLFASKSWVPPLAAVSIPRLEIIS